MRGGNILNFLVEKEENKGILKFDSTILEEIGILMTSGFLNNMFQLCILFCGYFRYFLCD